MTRRARRQRDELRDLQVELVKIQRNVIRHGHRVLVLFEGRDAAGKDGAIKRITEHLSPRDTRVVALGPPSDREHGQWYFQRWVGHLPAAGEIVLFNRSWYNRAGVERVMGFATKGEVHAFLRDVPAFEELLVANGLQLFKYYLDVSKTEQRRRLRARRRDPLTQWKNSEIDRVAVKHWRGYTKARDLMLAKSHAPVPWTMIRADDKPTARLNLIRDLVTRIDCPDKSRDLAPPDPKVVFQWTAARGRRLAR